MKHEDLDITCHKDIQKGEFTAAVFWMYMSIAETTCLQCKGNGLYTKKGTMIFQVRYPRVIEQTPLSLWVLAGNMVTRASANLSVVSTFVRMGRRLSLVNFWKPWREVFMLRALRVPTWRIWDSDPASSGSREGWVFSHKRLGLCYWRLVLWHIVRQALLKGAQRVSCMVANSLRQGITDFFS